MSAPEAKLSYDMEVKLKKKQQLYQLFLDWALTSKVDGIVVGATFPKIIQYCANKTGKKNEYFLSRCWSSGWKCKDGFVFWN